MEETVNQDRNAVFVTIPAKVSADQESVRSFWVQNDDPQRPQLKLAEITLPKGTEINGQDASYYKLVVRDFQVDPGGQKYPSTHSLQLLDHNRETGEQWNLTLKRDFGQYDADKNWVPDEKEIKCTSRDLQEAMKAQYENYKQYRQERQAEREADKGVSLNNEAKDMRDASGELGSQEPSKGAPTR